MLFLEEGGDVTSRDSSSERAQLVGAQKMKNYFEYGILPSFCDRGTRLSFFRRNRKKSTMATVPLSPPLPISRHPSLNLLPLLQSRE